MPLPDWLRINRLARVNGDLKAAPADFQVTEILPFEPDGAGEHEFLWIEKTGANTAWVAGGLARFVGVAERDIGYAGMKDRHAVTRQWFSVRRGGAPGPDWGALALEGVRILRATRHGRKLRRGVHAGNRFDIVLRNISNLSDDLHESLQVVATAGVPNYFGAQRFGRGARNLDQASELFAGKRLQRNKRSLALSAARAYLFNRVLAARVNEGSWSSLREGDCAILDGSASLFAVPKVDAELEQRCRRLDLHPSGPLWGSGGAMVAGETARLEQSVADQHAALSAGLERETTMRRRPLRVADTYILMVLVS